MDSSSIIFSPHMVQFLVAMMIGTSGALINSWHLGQMGKKRFAVLNTFRKLQNIKTNIDTK